MTRDEFERHFRATFPNLLGGKVVIALSGGADSVALLHLMRGEALGLELEAAHVHHGVRGREADDDAAFCENLCAQLETPFHLLRLEPDIDLAVGREAAWRRARYRLLLALASELGATAVATGHQRDDIAEGVLVQLLRGGGPRALAGIATATATGTIRPLLPWSRTELTSWLRRHGLRWCEDSTNRDLQHLRNRVRHHILPDLELVSPGLRNHLLHLADVLAGDEGWFAEDLRARALWIDPWEPDGGVAVDAVRGLPLPLRSRWLHAQAARIGISRVTRRQCDLLERLVDRGQPRAVSLGGRWRLRLARRRLWLEPPDELPHYSHTLKVGVWKRLPLPGWRIRVAADPSDSSADLRWSFRLPEGARLEVRSPRCDDRVLIDGVSVSARKVLARALPRHLRRAWPLCCDSDRILWIPGVWQSPEESPRASHVVEVMRRD
jgi:tRNA(Ile)-lysidine synthase